MKKTWMAAGERLVSRAAHIVEHHPRQLVAAVAALLLTTGGGAFAVASFGPDPSLLPVREILEYVEPLPLEPQSEALDAHSFSLFTAERVRSSDTAEALLARLGVNDAMAAAFLRSDALARPQVLGAPGRTVHAEATDGRNLLRLTARWAVDNRHSQRLVVERQPSGTFTSRIEAAPLVASLQVANGTVRTSLFQAADDAGIPDAVTTQLVDIFGGDIDFHRHLRVGDRFAVVYETLEVDGEPMRTGRVVSAHFENGGRVLQALWFQEPGQRGGYFDFEGRSLERVFLASPMAVSRITSGFKMRMHPVLNIWRAHKGVDYAAPTGTPVRTVGDGVVDFAGTQGGYGNVIEIDHGQGISTLYAHLSRIDVRRGQRVERGQRIGAVGATGWATGPHLHYEFKENGAQKDPLQMARRFAPAPELSAQGRQRFEQIARSMRTQLAVAAGSEQVASAR